MERNSKSREVEGYHVGWQIRIERTLVSSNSCTIRSEELFHPMPCKNLQIKHKLISCLPCSVASSKEVFIILQLLTCVFTTHIHSYHSRNNLPYCNNFKKPVVTSEIKWWLLLVRILTHKIFKLLCYAFIK